jgi:isoamylase
MAYRLTGSSDLYEWSGRKPSASINFVTAHDGFTLADLVSYDEKHNEANGEDNRDGESHNRSWNHGTEGPTDDPHIRAGRRRSQRNLLSTLLLSQGVPMLLYGDEIGRTQHGNNNAYCQDNEVSWLDWSLADENADLLTFTRRLLEFRRAQPVLRQRRWFQGRPIHGSAVSDIAWFRPDGDPMSEDDWAQGYAKSISVFLNGERFDDGDSLLLVLNAHPGPLGFTVPGQEFGTSWRVALDTADPTIDDPTGGEFKPGDVIEMEGASLRVLKRGFPST